MPRTAAPLTNTEVKQAKPKDKEYSLADGEGLLLRVRPNGGKLWIFNYTHPHTKKRANISLGSYPDVSLAAAREKAADARKLLKEGNIDPKLQRDEEALKNKLAHENTLSAIVDQWLAVKKSQVSADHAKDSYRSLELHILPTLGNCPIKDIKAPLVINTLKPVAAKGSLETVKRLCQRMNEVMYFAVNHGLIDNNPLAKIADVFQSPEKQHMPTLKPDELPRLMQTLAQASIKRTTRCLIEWQLHTMVRPSEAAGTRWAEINFDTGLWTIPAERMKKKREHIVPLSEQSLALLEVMKPISLHREHVFPADRDPRSHANPATANVALKRMGFAGELVSHGLRALASTTLNESGLFSPDVIEAALAHVDANEVRAAYNRALYLEQRTVLMSWWSKHIEQAAMGSLSMAKVKQGAEVIQLNKAA